MSSKTTFLFDRFMKVHQTREAFSNEQPQWMYTVKRESLNRPEVNTEMGKVFRKYLVIALSLRNYRHTIQRSRARDCGNSMQRAASID